MTREEDIYYSTLNLFGSDVEPPEIQRLIDREHAAAEPVFAAELKLRQVLGTVKRHKFVTGFNAGCGHFDTPVERELYQLAGRTWNHLQALSSAVDELLKAQLDLEKPSPTLTTTIFASIDAAVGA